MDFSTNKSVQTSYGDIKDIDVRSFTTPQTIYQLNDNIYLYVRNRDVVTESSLYMSCRYASEILASLGVYACYTIPTSYESLDTMIDNGTLILGEMRENGHTTGRWLKTKREIENAVNYNKSLENEELDPTSRGGTDDYEDDKSDSVKYGRDVNNYLGAFLNFYCCTSSDLASLKAWMRGYTPPEGEELPAGFDPINQIVSLMAFPLAINLSGTVGGSSEIKFRTAQGKSVSTGISCPVSTGGVYKIDFGSIAIPKRMEERGVPFLDYGSTIEIYLPFAGVYNLDVQTVIGRTLSVYGFLCVATGQINYIVIAKKGSADIPVCYASGTLSAQMPITSSGWGTYLANFEQGQSNRWGAVANAIGGLGSAFGTITNATGALDLGEQIAGQSLGSKFGQASLATGIIGGAVSIGVTAANVIHSIKDANIGIQHNMNASYTSVNGSLSGTSAWFMPLHPYVRIIRPRFKLPSNYPHTVAIPQVQTKTIGSCHGLTICNNTDVSSINCTEQERSLISQYLSNGIYV